MGINVTLPFDTPANYVLSGTEVGGGEASLINLRPADLEFLSKFDTKDAEISPTDGTGTLQNGAVITASTLDLRPGTSGARCDYPASNANTILNNVASIRLRAIPDYSGAPPADAYFYGSGVASGNVDLIQCYHRQGGGAAKAIIFQLYDDAGALIISVNAGEWDPVAGTEYEWEWCWDIVTGVLRIFLDGALFYENLALNTGNRSGTNDRFRVGNSRNGANKYQGQISGFAMFDVMAHTAPYTPNTIGTELVPPDYFEGTVETVASWAAQSINSFNATVDETDGTVRFGIETDGQLKWWDGAAWSNSDGTDAELNTAADINANVSTLVTASAETIKIFARLTSTDGTGEPTLDEISFEYDFGSLAPSASPTCELYGFLRDMAGTPVPNATVTARPRVDADYIESADPAIILGEVSAVTDADGRFDLKVIQGLEIRLTFEDEDGRRVRFKHDTYERLDITVPASDFADLTTLL